MRITSINARKDRAGKHNDRNFDLDKAPHIDQARVCLNKYYTYNNVGIDEISLAENEEQFYEDHFAPYLQEHNEIAKKARHYSRVKSIEEYHKGQNTRPEDKLLQIGNKYYHPSGDTLWECVQDYRERFERIFGEHCKILDMSLHLDEETPHVHLRRVWIATDPNGKEYVSQTKALEQLGITEPDTTKPISKTNNAKMSLTAMDLELFQDVCIEHGLPIEKTPRAKRKHLETDEFKELAKEATKNERMQLERDRKIIAESKEELDDICEEAITILKQAPRFIYVPYRDEIQEARKKSRKEYLSTLIKIFSIETEKFVHSKAPIDELVRTAGIRREVEKMEDYLKRNGLYDDYKNGSEKQFNEPDKEKKKV